MAARISVGGTTARETPRYVPDDTPIFLPVPLHWLIYLDITLQLRHIPADIQLYEYDFEGQRGDRTYYPSLRISY